jgi:molecular chaperone GrpE
MTDAPTPVDRTVEDIVDAPGPTDAPTDEAGAGPAPEEDAAPEAQEDWELLAADDVRSRAELLAELTEAEARRDEYLDALQRARAEFDNFRKRTLKEGAALRTHGQADVVSRLLDVLDDFDRTMEAIDGADEGLVTGIGLVRDKLYKTLADVGLERIDQVGIPFDPNTHEAVQRQSADPPIGEPHVAEIFRPGYRLGDRVLRAAMVVVEQ